MTEGYSQGGDAKAIKRVAEQYYGSYRNMFEAHGWPERSTQIMPAVQARVVEAYGSVVAFERRMSAGALRSLWRPSIRSLRMYG